MIYIASPYTHESDKIRDLRYRLVKTYTQKRLDEGALVFSPIVYGHGLTDGHPERIPFEYWAQMNDHLIHSAEAVEVLMLPGWELSRGIAHEVDLAQRLYLPISYVRP